MPVPDSQIYPFFSQDHRECDALWAELEAADDVPLAKARWAEFRRRMERHLAMEEEVLFPAFEDATGMRNAGPTEMMRHEHRQMRALLQQIGERIEVGDQAGALDHGDTLMMLIAQHNAKEENMLYPMADNVLGDAKKAVVARLAPYLAAPARS